MTKFEVDIIWETGLHARPAGEVVKLANTFKSTIVFSNGDDSVDAKSILGVLTLGAVYQSKVFVTIEGDDEKDAETKLKKFFSSEF